MSEMLEAALKYAAAGWPCFPCGRDKAPLIRKADGGKGCHDATTDAAKIREWWTRWPNANIGCHVGDAGMMVLDLDPGHDLAELHRVVEGLPDTKLRQRTPRGGEHLFYALDDGEKISPSASKLTPAVDVRSWGSYVLLAPSETDDGAYTWAHENTWPPQPMPKPAHRTPQMVAACGQKRERVQIDDERLIPADLPDNIAAAIDYLNSDKCQPAIEGRGGDDMTFRTACMMHSYGLSQDVALMLMHDVYNGKCEPPWDYDELAVKVANGYAYKGSAFGNLTEAYKRAMVAKLFKPAVKATPSGVHFTAGRYTVVDREGMEHLADPEWLIPDLIPVGGYALLVGAPGTFKTFVALDIALSVATGDATGRRAWPTVKRQGRVLVAVGEGVRGLRARAKAWEAQHAGGAQSRNLTLAYPVPLVSAGLAEWEAFCDAVTDPLLDTEGYDLVILDTAGRSLQGLNENSQEHVSLLTQLVQLLQSRLGCAVLVVHHTGHGDQSRAKGSGVFEADPDTVLVLCREGKSRLVELRMKKQKDGAEWDDTRPLLLVDSAGSLAVVAATDADRPAKPQPPGPPKSETIVPEILDTTIGVVLKTFVGRIWSTTDFCETLAMRPEIEISSKQLRDFLTTLRERDGSIASRCYDPDAKKWRWRD